MTTHCTVIVSRYASLCWQLGDRIASGDWPALAEAMASAGEKKIHIVLMPDWYSVHRVEFIDAERKMLAKTVPYSLEDELADDIEDNHFALASPRDNDVDVVVVNRAKLAGLMDTAAEVGLEVSSVKTCPIRFDNPFWLQLGEDAAALLCSDNQVVFEQRQMTAMRQIINDVPHVYRLFAGVEAWTLWHDNSDTVAALPSLSMLEDGIELLQGEFRKGVAWPLIWRAWRAPAIAASVLMVALIAQAWWQVGLLETRNLEYRQAIEKTYREAFPKGRVVNPRRQMEAKLAELSTGQVTSGSNMLALLSSLSSEPNAASLTVSGINYEARAGELRIDILADNFQQVEKLRTALRERGVKAELQNSSAAGNKVRAKLALKEVG